MESLTRFCSALAVLTACTLSARAADPTTINLDVNGTHREALVFAPSSLPKSGGSPLVFVFHGHGGNAQNISRSMHIQNIWHEAIVVYPQGLPTITRIDPEGKKAGWQRAPGDDGDRDLKFFDALLAAVHKKFTVDDHRIYAAGFSNGSLFTFLLLGERANTFAAFAPCAGPPSQGLKLSTPKPVFIIAGEKDPIVAISNQREAIERVRKLDDATAPGKAAEEGVTLYASPKGTAVETLIHPAGHLIPPEAPKLIVEFFKAHELKK